MGEMSADEAIDVLCCASAAGEDALPSLAERARAAAADIREAMMLLRLCETLQRYDPAAYAMLRMAEALGWSENQIPTEDEYLAKLEECDATAFPESLRNALDEKAARLEAKPDEC